MDGGSMMSRWVAGAIRTLAAQHGHVVQLVGQDRDDVVLAGLDARRHVLGQQRLWSK